MLTAATARALNARICVLTRAAAANRVYRIGI